MILYIAFYDACLNYFIHIYFLEYMHVYLYSHLTSDI